MPRQAGIDNENGLKADVKKKYLAMYLIANLVENLRSIPCPEALP